MKHIGSPADRIRNITHCLSYLPRMILQLDERDNVTEFILHELCKSDCFNLKRAAYVIDNPDFDCLKGVAGYCKEEMFSSEKNIWDQPDLFSEHMKKASYNNKIRAFSKPSFLKKGESGEAIVQEIASDINFKTPSFYAWPMQHDNQGLLIYEKMDNDTCDCDYLLEGLCIIGFCPIF